MNKSISGLVLVDPKPAKFEIRLSSSQLDWAIRDYIAQQFLNSDVSVESCTITRKRDKKSKKEEFGAKVMLTSWGN